MSFWSKLFAGSGAAAQAVPAKSGYTEADNLGTRHDTLGHATGYWMARMSSQKKDPFAMYFFDRHEDACAALLELPCIHAAKDTGNLICTETLTFGYYNNENGAYEALICGDDLTLELWEQAKASFEKHGGRRKNDLAPLRRAAPPAPSPQPQPANVTFLREDRQQKMGRTLIYRIHKAPDAASARAFLEKNPIQQQLYYLVVETPDGNYCRDIDGIYKE